MLEYAIIRSNSTGYLKVLKLALWSPDEWELFNTVKNNITHTIEWFDTKEEAIAFMFCNFDPSIIEEQYHKVYNKTRTYYI